MEVTSLISEMAGVTIVPHKDVMDERITLTLKDKPVDAALQAIAEAYDLVLKIMPETGMYIIRRGDAKADRGRVVTPGGGDISGAPTVPVRPEVVLPGSGATPESRPALPTRPPARETVSARPNVTSQPSNLKRASIPIKYAVPSSVASWFGCPSLDVSMAGLLQQYPPQVHDIPSTGVVSLGDTVNRNDKFLQKAIGRRSLREPLPRFGAPLAAYSRDQFGDEAGGGVGAGGGLGQGGQGGLGGGQNAGVFELPEGITDLVGYDLLRALIVRGEPEAIEELRELVELLDQPPLQIEIEAKFVTLSVNDANSYGIVWTVTDGTSVISGSTPGQGGASVAFQTSTGNAQALLTAIVRDNAGKVVNAPKVATQNGQPAVVEFAQEIPVTTSNLVVTESSQTVSTFIEIIPVQTLLFVVPRVVGEPPDEAVNVIIQPQISDIAGFVDNPSGGTIPIVAEQTVQTMLRVRDGETIAMGGLIRKNNSESSTKVPFLGDLPFIGNLFRSRTRTVDESELLIFLTPRILREIYGVSGPTAVR